MTKERPEYVTCALVGTYIGDPPQRERKTWCGRPLQAFDFYFVDATHALLNAQAKGRLLLYHECAEAIVATAKRAATG